MDNIIMVLNTQVGMNMREKVMPLVKVPERQELLEVIKDFTIRHMRTMIGDPSLIQVNNKIKKPFVF